MGFFEIYDKVLAEEIIAPAGFLLQTVHITTLSVVAEGLGALTAVANDDLVEFFEPGFRQLAQGSAKAEAFHDVAEDEV